MARKGINSLPIWLYDPKVKDSHNKNFIRLSHSLLTHPKFLSLSKSSQLVYIYMVLYSKGQREFSYPKRMYINIVSQPKFSACVKELSKNGFIEVKCSGKNTRTENIYTFSSNWHNNH